MKPLYLCRYCTLAPLACLIALGCQAVPQPTSRPASWTCNLPAPRICRLPESWNGPLDTSPVGIPLRFAAALDGRVGIVWGWPTLKMVVLGPEGIEASGTLRDFVGSVPYRRDRYADLGNLLYVHGKWHVLAGLPGGGIALARFDANGWERPVVVAPKEIPTDLWLCVEDDTSHVFWTARVIPGLLPALFHYFTLGSIDTVYPWGLRHAVVRQDKLIRIDEACRQPYSRFSQETWDTSHILDLGQGRYDFLVACHPPAEGSPGKLVHIGNVLESWKSSPTCIGKGDPYLNSVALALPGGIIQAFGVMQPEIPTEGIPRIFEVCMEKGVWSPPRIIAEGKPGANWEISSLAAASFPMDRQQGVIVIWRNDEGHLAYAVGTPDHRWSEPVNTDWKIGWPNQLVYARDRFILLTMLRTGRKVRVMDPAHPLPAGWANLTFQDEEALYWCPFTLQPQNPSPTEPHR